MTSPASPPSPLSTPLPWDLVSAGYAAVSFDQFSKYAADALALAEVGPSDRVLDVATGPGSLALQAATRALEVEALDFSKAMLAELRARLEARRLTNIRVFEGDGQALPQAGSNFDAAFSMFGLMFFPARARGFSELFRVLRPGGRAVVSSWQPMSSNVLLTTVFEALAAELPHLPFGDGKGPSRTPTELRNEMAAAGFTVTVEARCTPRRRRASTCFGRGYGARSRPWSSWSTAWGWPRPRGREGIERRLRERFPGPVRVEMPAWLALGRRPA